MKYGPVRLPADDLKAVRRKHFRMRIVFWQLTEYMIISSFNQTIVDCNCYCQMNKKIITKFNQSIKILEPSFVPISVMVCLSWFQFISQVFARARSPVLVRATENIQYRIQSKNLSILIFAGYWIRSNTIFTVLTHTTFSVNMWWGGGGIKDFINRQIGQHTQPPAYAAALNIEL